MVRRLESRINPSRLPPSLRKPVEIPFKITVPAWTGPMVVLTELRESLTNEILYPELTETEPGEHDETTL